MARALMFAALALLGCTREVQVLQPPGADAGAPRDSGPRDAGNTRGGSALAASTENSCWLFDGALYCWGSNMHGQLAQTAGGGGAPAPLRIGGANDWVAVGLGERHACGLRADGTLYCWGSNDNGQLGLGDLRSRDVPERVGQGAWAQLAVGQRHTCAIDLDDLLWCWGDNYEGQLGLADRFGTADERVPRRVASERRYLYVSAADGHTCAIALNGSIECWGRNTNSQLGIGSRVPDQVRTPTPVESTDKFLQVEITQHHSCAIRNDGALFCWGEDTHGELGQGFDRGSDTELQVPTRVGDRNDWQSLELHWFHTCGITGDRALRCFGRNDEGQLGDGYATREVGLPQVMPGGGSWLRVAVGRFHTCAEEATRGVLCWGDNEVGQLGVGDYADRGTPEPIVR